MTPTALRALLATLAADIAEAQLIASDLGGNRRKDAAEDRADDIASLALLRRLMADIDCHQFQAERALTVCEKEVA